MTVHAKLFGLIVSLVQDSGHGPQEATGERKERNRRNGAKWRGNRRVEQGRGDGSVREEERRWEGKLGKWVKCT